MRKHIYKICIGFTKTAFESVLQVLNQHKIRLVQYIRTYLQYIVTTNLTSKLTR